MARREQEFTLLPPPLGGELDREALGIGYDVDFSTDRVPFAEAPGHYLADAAFADTLFDDIEV